MNIQIIKKTKSKGFAAITVSPLAHLHYAHYKQLLYFHVVLFDLFAPPTVVTERGGGGVCEKGLLSLYASNPGGEINYLPLLLLTSSL